MDKIRPGSPFRATRLWNMVASAFQRQMPVGKHWCRLQKYEDCFTASAAVDWMHEYLKMNPNFGEKSTREIAVKMLQKLLSHDAFEPVRASGRDQELLVFKEDSQLYKFSTSLNKGQRPLSTNNGHLPQGGSVDTECPPKITAEDVWIDEFYICLTKVLKLDSSANIFARLTKMIDVTYLLTNVNNPPLETKEIIPEFVLAAIKALENWPETPKGVPNSRGFERCLLHVVECYLRGLQHSLIDTATADLLKKCFDLSPSIQRRQSFNPDTTSSVESFIMEILGSDTEGGLPDVCFETAFTGTLPETRLIRKRPRSNSLFPCTEFSLSKCPSMSGSADNIIHKSASDSGSTGSSSALPPIPTTPDNLHFGTNGSSLEKINPGYRHGSLEDLPDSFFTPVGKCGPDVNWEETQSVLPNGSFPEILRGMQLVLLSASPKCRAILKAILPMFQSVFKNNQLGFSDDLPTQSFVTHCFAPMILPGTEPVNLGILTLMVFNHNFLFENPADFKLKVELRMKFLGIVPAFCKRITRFEYEEHKRLQNEHITLLLDNIIKDTNMHVKDKRKKLKQFRKAHPDVYAARFTNSTSEESIFAACAGDKPKARLTKFKSLRL